MRSQNRKELLKRMMAEKGIRLDSRRDRIPRRPADEPPRPSHAQQRLWVMERLTPLEGAYNISETLRLSGTLDIALLDRCIQTILARHEGLRCRFPEAEDQPTLVIEPELNVAIARIDGQDLNPEQVQATIDAFALETFDLERGPLVRVALLALGPDEHLLLLAMHHIISDAWSLGVVVDELAKLYSAFREGKENPLEPLTVQYTDYASWQWHHLEGARSEALDRFWSEALAGAPECLQLPTDFTRPPVQGHRGAGFDFTFEDDQYRAVQAFHRERGCTLFTCLQAAFHVLLYRYTESRDLVLGTPVAGRSRPELEPLVGFFVNTLALRQRIDPAEPFADFLARVHRDTLAAFDHQDMPFDRVVNLSRARRNPAYHPVFQVMFIVQNAPVSKLSLPDLELELVPKQQRTSKFDLLVELHEQDGTLNGLIDYNTDLFREETIERMAAHFRVALATLLKAPETPVGHVPILTEAEKTALSASWSSEPLEQPSVLARVCAGLQGHPERIAYRHRQERLTYAQVDDLSDRIAYFLQEQGIQNGDLVPVLMRRDWRVPVAVLGIMKAGAAFVPLDATWPEGRIGRILDQLASPLVLVDAEDAKPADRPETAVVVDWATFPDQTAPHPVAISGDDLIYCIYTSGSTGEPKGALNMHKGVANRFQWMDGYFEPTAEDVVLQTTHHVFDSMMWQFFWPLTFGGCSVLPEQRALFDLEALVTDIEGNGVTITDFVPSELEALVYILARNPEKRRRLEGLRALIVGGEAMGLESVRTFLSWFPGVRVTNLYGPTECAIATIYHPVTRAQTEPVPIGKPLPNTAAIVLSQEGMPQPVGVAGELHLGGICVGKGYFGQSKKTRAVFIDSPVPEILPGTLYKTGDLAKLNSDGTIEYLGRIDHQLKLRGFRIEAGEIEQALTAHPEIQAASVILRALDGEKRIVAFYLADETVSQSELSTFLAQTLPEYMIPSHFEALETLPRTPGGKLDRKYLETVPLGDRIEKPSAARPPGAGNEEARIRAIWSELLDREDPGLHENFFDLGGHSLLLVKLQARLEETFERTFTAVDLFDAATIARQAALVRGRDEVPAPNPRPTTPRTDRSERDIAIIGMAVRLPGAEDASEFWENLLAGRTGIVRFDDQELLERGVDASLIQNPAYVKAGGPLKDADLFDAAFFGFSPREAQLTDPQQRVMLELAWHALEHAGYAPDRTPGTVGVFAGSGMNTYLLGHLMANRALIEDTGLMGAAIGNEKDFLATRIAYKLNLEGPAVSVQTACSTASTAIYQAVWALREGTCDTALAGGISIDTFQDRGYLFQEDGIQSPDGTCRPFDKDAKGTVGGSGGGFLVLKPLSRALADGDTIWSVIKGVAMTNDGAGKAGFTAPAVKGQAEVLSRALDDAGLPPESISFIETHGTATPLGDPIEVEALHRVYGRLGAGDTIALGAVKSTIGHLNSAAGVAGVVKAALALRSGTLPSTLHFREPNPRLGLEKGPFFVNPEAELLAPREDGQPHRAGISSFGIGGTNVHIILETPPERDNPSPESGPFLLPISARSVAACYGQAANLIHHLSRPDAHPLADIAHTLIAGRSAFSHRRFILARDRGDALGKLIHDTPEIRIAEEARQTEKPAFLFPGQGAQHPGMVAEPYAELPLFRQHLDACLNASELDLAPFLLDATIDPGALADTAIAQPAIFAASYSMARTLMDLGLKPSVMLGHSIGAFVAAALAGVFSLEDALRIVVRRGALMAEMPHGKMLSLACSADDAAPYLSDQIALAAVNGPERVVLSGDAAAIDALTERLDARGLSHTHLHTSHAFHSPLLDDAVPRFREAFTHVRLSPPKIPIVSDHSSAWITDDQAVSPDYWARHLRAPVLFHQGLTFLQEQGFRSFVDTGPGQVAAALVKQSLPRASCHAVMPHAKHRGSATDHVLSALGRLWQMGYPLELGALTSSARRVPLPGYPFERKRYWIDPADAPTATISPMSQKKKPMERWAYLPTWEPAPLPMRQAKPERIVLFSNQQSTGQGLRIRCEEAGIAFGRLADDLSDWTWQEDSHILFAMGLDEGSEPSAVETLRKLVAECAGRSVRLTVFTHQAQFLPGDTEHHPTTAPLIGMGRVIPMELPDLATRLVDLEATIDPNRLVDLIWREALAPPDTEVVAWRGMMRYREAHMLIDLPKERPDEVLPRRDRLVIFGGLGRIGLALAEHLFATRESKLVLVGRTPRKHLSADRSAQLAALEEKGAEILCLSADIGVREQCFAALDRARDRFGAVDGIFHLAGSVVEAGSQALTDLTEAAFARQFRAKVEGTRHLGAWMATHLDTDFCLIFSSLSAFLGGLGFGAYAAANRFQDSFVQQQNLLALKRREPARFLSIDWDGWQTNPDSEAGTAMTFAEGMEIMDRFFAREDLTQLLISTTDMTARKQRWQMPVSAGAEDETAIPSTAGRPDLATTYRAPESALEKQIAAIWQTLFGFSEIGLDDNFFDLGGDSLLATRYFTQLRAKAEVSLPLASLFDAPTLAEQAALAALAGEKEASPSEDMIEELI